MMLSSNLNRYPILAVSDLLSFFENIAFLLAYVLQTTRLYKEKEHVEVEFIVSLPNGLLGLVSL